mmetsp:Transcript_36419/g.93946  ORF Transcript_36419/g.93946 Transcript_36419/m.93946 type:complete len:421 (-) Transcript_36419:321-1583(-)
MAAVRGQLNAQRPVGKLIHHRPRLVPDVVHRCMVTPRKAQLIHGDLQAPCLRAKVDCDQRDLPGAELFGPHLVAIPHVRRAELTHPPGVRAVLFPSTSTWLARRRGLGPSAITVAPCRAIAFRAFSASPRSVAAATHVGFVLGHLELQVAILGEGHVELWVRRASRVHQCGRASRRILVDCNGLLIGVCLDVVRRKIQHAGAEEKRRGHDAPERELRSRLRGRERQLGTAGAADEHVRVVPTVGPVPVAELLHDAHGVIDTGPITHVRADAPHVANLGPHQCIPGLPAANCMHNSVALALQLLEHLLILIHSLAFTHRVARARYRVLILVLTALGVPTSVVLDEVYAPPGERLCVRFLEAHGRGEASARGVTSARVDAELEAQVVGVLGQAPDAAREVGTVAHEVPAAVPGPRHPAVVQG